MRVGLLDQEVQRLDGHRTILDEAMAAIAVPTPDEITRVRTLLHAFLFRAEDLDKLVATLSTGERKRLALLKVTLAEVNLLVLDEPTDHLDIEAREKLEEVLESYEGTLIFTSHDRYFLQRVCTKILAIQRGTVVPYLGGYHYYEEKQQETGSASGRCGPGGTVSGPAAGLESGPPRTALSRDERLLIETRLAQLGAELARVPKEDPSYAQLEAEYLRLARRLNAGSR